MPRARVLVIEDQSDTAATYAMLLEDWGFDCRICSHGGQALDVARDYRPHIIFLDIGLPGLDGYEVNQLVRRDPALQNPLVVVITGYGRPEDRSQAKTAGCDYHFVKPVDPLKLEEILAVFP